jgi:hypothetical protein
LEILNLKQLINVINERENKVKLKNVNNNKNNKDKINIKIKLNDENLEDEIKDSIK